MTAQVNAWSLRKSNFQLESAYIGLYPDGLGLTDRGEGNGSNNRHRLDNIGNRWNFISFKFNSLIVPDRAFLTSVGPDSDIVVFAANVPGTAPVTIAELIAALNNPILARKQHRRQLKPDRRL